MTIASQLIDRLLPSSEGSSLSKRKKRRYTSRLDPYKLEIFTLRDEMGCSEEVIKKWLLMKKGIQVSRCCVRERIKYWRKNRSSINEQ